MIWADILIGNKSWLWPVAGIIVAGGLLLLWGYRKSGSTTGVRIAGGLLKICGIILLALCVVEPLWSGTRARPGANLFLVLADNSRSMQIRDSAGDESRGERVRELLDAERAGWLTRLQQDFDVRQFLFDSRLKRTEDFAELDFEGTASSLETALETIRERYRNRPTAGVLLLTDGNAGEFSPADWDPSGLPPIYPVLTGGERTLTDVAIELVSITQTSFEDTPVTVRAEVAALNVPSGTKITARLLDLHNQIVDTQTELSPSEGDPLSFRFRFRPKREGMSFYKLQVAPAEEISQFEPAGKDEKPRVESSEATTANNTRLIEIDRGREPFRVLYVSGRPNWEFKFLNRALEEDRQIQLAALMRIAKREAKFDFRGRTGESSNPLFRGFKKESDAETERYDEPVFVRLNMKNSGELRGGFPKDDKTLFEFHAIVLDDVEAPFFTRDQMELMDRFVSERGGGLLMLGGLESFRNGEYNRTPIGDMLPVYLDRTAPAEDNARYRLALTKEGWLEPWARLRDNESDERKRLKEMPTFHTLNPIENIKPGATVIAHATDVGGHHRPALIVQRYGRGRTAALAIADLWRWGLRREDQTDDLGKAWRQMIRWMVADVPRRIEAAAEPVAGASGTGMRMQVRVRDESFHPQDNSSVHLVVHTPAGEAIRLDAEPSLEEAGLYETLFVPRVPGAYRTEITVKDADGKETGMVESGFSSNPAADEFRSIAINRRLIEELAEKTGGEVVEADSLEEFAATLPGREVPITEQWTWPLWHQSWVFLLAIACFAGEWGLRRWRGLP